MTKGVSSLNSDMIVHGGKIYTMKTKDEVYQWMAINDGKIVCLGNEEPFNSFVGESTEIINLQNHVVIPGLYDCHVHLVQSGLNSEGIELLNVKSISELLDLIKKKTKTIAVGQLIKGYHFDVTKIEEKRFPTRYELDNISPDHPVWINSIEFHTSAINSLALNIVDLPYNIDGIKRDERNLPLGYFTGKASAYIRNRLLSGIDDSTRERGVQLKIAEAIKKGITTINAMEGGFSFHENDAKFISKNRSRYPIDIRLYYQSFDLEKASLINSDGIGGDIFIDGSFNSRTAAISKKYKDMDTYGNLYFNQDELNYFVSNVIKNDWQLALHAIGDRAIDQTLNAYAQVFSKETKSNHRCRIEHFELASEEQIKKAKELNLIISVQPSFEYFWGIPNGMYEKRLDETLSKRTNNFRKMVDEGLVLCGGSDSDVTEINPILGIHSAVNHPKPQFGLSVFEALEMFTKNAAFASFEEKTKGTLEIGKLADFCILNKNIFEIEKSEILTTEINATFKEGHNLYCADSFFIEVKTVE
jgi:predicted amidohydrolase YtcJ